ncbi:MAG: SDR family NAD(P)-dependent oxidoreductase [Pseudorhodobacter sp.]|nr:SDR family NAD(P)-dependent oxidoreductase [Pseudorhodobacter sp.]
MRALVSDATGLIGKRIVARLLATGAEVVGLTKAVATPPPGARFLPWPGKPGDLAAALEAIDVVIVPDLAGESDVPLLPAPFERLITVAAGRVGRIVLLSRADIYLPAALADGTVAETGPFATDDPAQPKPGLAALLEQCLRAAPGNAERVVLRLPVVLGRDSESAHGLVDQLLDDPQQPWPAPRLHALDADDLADATLIAARHPAAAGHAFNLAGPFAVAGEVAASEIRRLGAVLGDQFDEAIQVRPDHALAPALLATGKAAQMLGFVPRKDVFTSLAELVQEGVARRRRTGALPAIVPLMPAALIAVERGEKPLAGKVVVVTGATSGLGRAAAVLLARLGAQVVAVGRNAEAGAALVDEVRQRPGWLPPDFRAADLSAQADLRRLAAALCADHPVIDGLVNAAGAAYPTRRQSVDGIEMTLAVNLLAPFLLSDLLAGPLRASGHARIINLGCEAHRAAPVDLVDLQGQQHFDPALTYGRAKFALVQVTYGLAAQIDGTGLAAHVFDPGSMRSDFIARNGLDAPDDPAMDPQIRQAQQTQRDNERIEMTSPQAVAVDLVNLMVAPEYAAANGLYVRNGEVVPSADGTYDQEAAGKLWEACLKLTTAHV